MKARRYAREAIELACERQHQVLGVVWPLPHLAAVAALGGKAAARSDGKSPALHLRTELVFSRMLRSSDRAIVME